jgi:hypothetical protein
LRHRSVYLASRFSQETFLSLNVELEVSVHHSPYVAGNMKTLSHTTMRRVLKNQYHRTERICTVGRLPGATFLSLPTELRFQIYDIVKDFNLAQVLELDDLERQSPLKLPLQNLARSCSTIAPEIRHHRLSLPRSERYATVVARGDYGNTILTRAPYPVADLITLNIVFEASFAATPNDSRWRGTQPLLEDLFFGLFETIMDVQVFVRAKKDARKPPNDRQYEASVRWYRRLIDDDVKNDMCFQTYANGIEREMRLMDRDLGEETSECVTEVQQELMSRKDPPRYVNRWSCGLVMS